MEQSIINLVAFVWCAFVWCALGVLLLVRTRMRDAAESRRRWWNRTRKQRDDLLDSADRCVARGEFRERQLDESPWTYAKAFDHWAADQVDVPPSSSWSDPIPRSLIPTRLLTRFTRALFSPAPRATVGSCDCSYVPGRNTHAFTWTTVLTYWWTTERDGLTHRVVALKNNDKQWHVLRCDHDALVEEFAIAEHLEGSGPLLTCVRCFGMLPK